jgi:hypothetical protein
MMGGVLGGQCADLRRYTRSIICNGDKKESITNLKLINAVYFYTIATPVAIPTQNLQGPKTNLEYK